MKQLSLPIYNLTGESVGTIDLDASVFAFEGSPTLLHQAVVSFMANRRTSTAHTKDRGEVQGTNKKPWRQKGTGNARAGSARSPIWRGGGITFGPRNDRNYSVRMPAKMRQGAFKLALSQKVADGKLMIVDSLESLDGKTKSWTKAVATFPEKANGMLVIDTAKSDMADRSIRNVEKNKYVPLEGFTIFDAVRFPLIVMTKDALEAFTAKMSGAQTAKAGK